MPRHSTLRPGRLTASQFRRTVSLQDMAPKDLVHFTLSSEAAVLTARHAHIRPKNGYSVTLHSSSVCLKLKFDDDRKLSVLIHEPEDTAGREKIRIKLVTGETFDVWRVDLWYSNGSTYALYTAPGQILSTAALIDTHFRTLFPSMKTVKFTVNSEVSALNAPEFLNPADPRIVEKLIIEDPLTFRALQSIYNSVKPSKKLVFENVRMFKKALPDVTAPEIEIDGAKSITNAQILELSAPIIRISAYGLTTKKIRFMIKEWINTGSSFKSSKSLEMLDIVASRWYLDPKYFEDIDNIVRGLGAKKFDPKRRSAVKWKIVGDEVLLFDDLRRGYDIERADGTLATVSVEGVYSARICGAPSPNPTQIRLHVWKNRFPKSPLPKIKQIKKKEEKRIRELADGSDDEELARRKWKVKKLNGYIELLADCRRNPLAVFPFPEE